MAKLFLLLSGEHVDLPVFEVKAMLESENCPYTVLEELDQILRIEADMTCIGAIERRAAFTRTIALEIFNCQPKIGTILKATHSTKLGDFLKKNESFVVRVRHVKNHASEINGMNLEQKLGELILDKLPNTKVNLKKPDKTFVGIFTNNRFLFGAKAAEIAPKPFVERRPRKKPFFHPSAMQAKLARCMVNLARPKKGETLMDPFCGTGSILIEGAMIGCRVLGLDIQRRMANGTLKNLTHYRIVPDGIIVADARCLPITKVDCVVSDPPYGRSATTLKRTTEQIVWDSLKAARELLDRGQKICMAAPKTLKISNVGVSLGYKHLESHYVYVHRTLTREIAVFEKE